MIPRDFYVLRRDGQRSELLDLFDALAESRKVRGACVVRASDGKRMSETVRGHVMPQRPEER